MSIPGEVILDDALDFTRNRLYEIAKDLLCSNSTVSAEIYEALKQPLHKRLPRLEALRYIPFYQKQTCHNDSLLKLSKLAFNALQSLHKKELSEITRYVEIYNPDLPFCIYIFNILRKSLTRHSYYYMYVGGGKSSMSQTIYLMQEIDWLNATFGL